MAKKQKPGQRQIHKALLESVINPLHPGPIKVICDLRNPDYYEFRSIENIQNAINIRNQIKENIEYKDIEKQQMLIEQYHDEIKQAISLLALARVERTIEYGTLEFEADLR